MKRSILETGRLALPFLLSSIAAAVNQLPDRFFLAQTGDCALEAVLPAGMLANIPTTVLATTIGYSATFIAQYHGGGHNRLAASAFVQGLFLTALWLTVPLCLGLSALCLYVRWRSSNWRRISLSEPNQIH